MVSLNLFDILQNILSESVSSKAVNDAIDNQYQVEIEYDEEGSDAKGKRIIEPYAYGITSAGNEVIRGFQYFGNTKRGIPKWKLFRLDRITSWNPTNNKFNLENSLVVNKFKPNDMGMSNVINYVKLDNDNYDNHQETNINNIKNNTTNINNTTSTISTNSNSNSTNTNSTLSKKIVIDDIITGKEKRTTLMLRNIPNKYTLSNLVEELNPSFWGKFDYINLPIDYDRKLNLGYAFINFVDPMHIILFYETYKLKKWTKYRSDKKMDMTYADKQGKKDINCKDEQTYFAENDKRFNFNTLQLKIEIPISHLDFFKKIYVNSVCVVQQDKHPIYNDKCFIVKSFGKKI